MIAFLYHKVLGPSTKLAFLVFAVFDKNVSVDWHSGRKRSTNNTNKARQDLKLHIRICDAHPQYGGKGVRQPAYSNPKYFPHCEEDIVIGARGDMLNQPSGETALHAEPSIAIKFTIVMGSV